MTPGLHCSPYFIFRNNPTIDLIRVGNFELSRTDNPDIHPVYYEHFLVSEITKEYDQNIVYMEID